MVYKTAAAGHTHTALVGWGEMGGVGQEASSNSCTLLLWLECVPSTPFSPCARTPHPAWVFLLPHESSFKTNKTDTPTLRRFFYFFPGKVGEICLSSYYKMRRRQCPESCQEKIAWQLGLHTQTASSLGGWQAQRRGSAQSWSCVSSSAHRVLDTSGTFPSCPALHSTLSQSESRQDSHTRSPAWHPLAWRRNNIEPPSWAFKVKALQMTTDASLTSLEILSSHNRKAHCQLMLC